MYEEEERIKASETNDAIQIVGLRKVYNNKTVAVKNLHYGVKKGEIFGFLGNFKINFFLFFCFFYTGN
jgi:ATP-binding cassette subfamily A (ABC1) protein 3